jgi:hypothetical protein
VRGGDERAADGTEGDRDEDDLDAFEITALKLVASPMKSHRATTPFPRKARISLP